MILVIKPRPEIHGAQFLSSDTPESQICHYGLYIQVFNGSHAPLHCEFAFDYSVLGRECFSPIPQILGLAMESYAINKGWHYKPGVGKYEGLK